MPNGNLLRATKNYCVILKCTYIGPLVQTINVTKKYYTRQIGTYTNTHSAHTPARNLFRETCSQLQVCWMLVFVAAAAFFF